MFVLSYYNLEETYKLTKKMVEFREKHIGKLRINFNNMVDGFQSDALCDDD